MGHQVSLPEGFFLLNWVHYFHLKKGAAGRGVGFMEDLLIWISSYLFINLRTNFLFPSED